MTSVLEQQHGRSRGFLAYGLGVWLVWLLLTNGVGIAVASTAFRVNGTAISHSAGLVWVLSAYAYYRRRRVEGSDAVVRGSKRVWLLAAGAIAVVYLLEFSWSKALAIPPEPYMSGLYDGKGAGEIALFVLSVLVIVPIGEEAAFRYFLLGTIPYKRGPIWKVTAVIVTSALFAVGHFQYEQTSTMVLLFMIGCVFAVARMASGGLVLPVALHAQAAVMGLVLSEFN